MKTYKQRTENILQKAQKQKALRKKVTISAISATACAAVTALSLVLFLPLKPPADPIEAYKNNEYYSVIKPLSTRFECKSKTPVYKNNFEKWTAGLMDFFAFKVTGTAPDYNGGNSAMDSTTGVPEFDMSDGTNGGEYVETTDNQVTGVIEGDLFKRTKTHIFYLAYPELRVYTIAGGNSELVHEYTVTTVGKNVSYAPEIYLSADGNTLTIVDSILSVQKSKRYTEVLTLDVSNPTQIKELGRNYLSGQYVSSRSVNGKLIIVNNFNVSSKPDFDDYASYIPQYGESIQDLQLVDGEDIIVPETISTNQHTVVLEVDQTTGKTLDCMALYSYSADIYASQSNLYLTRNYVDYGTPVDTNGEEQADVWPSMTTSMTEIVCLSYGDNGFAQAGGVIVEGTVLNQYSMDEYNGVFRVVTTINNPYTSASIYCVDMQTWEIIGSVKAFSPRGEDVQSARFDGEKAYVCTAEVVTLRDPVYVFNLSDPTNITYKDSGEIKGYSTSLVQFGDGLLLGIGYNDDRSLKIELYQETENSVEIVYTYEPEIYTSFSEEYKSYFIDRERGLFGLGVFASSYADKYSSQEYRLLYVDEYGIVEMLTISLTGDNAKKRATLIEDENGNGYFYMFGEEFKVVKIY